MGRIYTKRIENKMPMRIFGPMRKREEVKRGWRKLHEFNGYCLILLPSGWKLRIVITKI
jgi:hypothetical protein